MPVLYSKCPTCGADLYFNPKTEKNECDFCGGVFEIGEAQQGINYKIDRNARKAEQTESAATDETEGKMLRYKCSFCGAEVITAEDTSATFCVYCHRALVLSDNLSGEFKPDVLIPFKKNKEEAIEAFKSYRKGKILLPRDFYDEVNITKITGVYVPFWLYDCHVHEDMEGKGKKISTWSDSKNNYRKTDTYDVKRSASLEFKNIPADASSKIDDAIIDSIEPFDYNELKEFNYSYLSGFMAQRYDQSSEQMKDKAYSRATATISSKIDETCSYSGGVSKDKEDVEFKKVSSKYALMPVWLLYTEYKGKFYPFAMNGQTGKLIGNVPMSKFKIALYTIIPFLILLIITAFIMSFF